MEPLQALSQRLLECPPELQSLVDGLKSGIIRVEKVGHQYHVQVVEPSRRNNTYASITLDNVTVSTNCGNQHLTNKWITSCGYRVSTTPEIIERAISCAKKV